MAYLKIQTNQSMRKKVAQEILRTASELVCSELGKPKELVMVALAPDMQLMFSGTMEPAAFLELKSVGIPKAKMKSLSRALTATVTIHLKIPANRVYVKIIDIPRGMWGWRGGAG